MPRSNYPFLAKNQKQEDQRRSDDIDQLWNQLGSMGFQGNGRSFFTGLGEDGRLQTDRPTGIMNTNQGPRSVHEGEQVDIGSNGQFSVTPASEVGGQGNLQNIERATGMKGYQEGTPKEGTVATPTFQPLDSTAKTGTVATPTFKPLEGTGVAATPAFKPLGVGEVTVAGEKQTGTTGATATGAPATFDRLPETPEPEAPTGTYDPYMGRGLQRLERYADEESPREKAIRDAERERFAGEAAVRKGSAAQELAQRGITGREAATEQAMVGRQVGAEESAMMGGLRKAEADRAFQAAQQLPGEARSAALFEENKRQYDESMAFQKQQWGDTEGSRMVTDAAVMDEASFLKAHPNATAEDYAKATQLSDLKVKTAAHTLAEMKNSYTGSQLANYYLKNLDADWRTDAGAKQALNVHYDTLGGEAALGDFATWADTQQAALQDPRMTTTLGALKYELEKSGLDPEQIENIMDFQTYILSGEATVEKTPVWKVGGETFDTEEKAINHAKENGIDASSIEEDFKWSAIDQVTGEPLGEDGTTTGTTTVATGEAATDWKAFDSSQQSIPEDQRLDYADWLKLKTSDGNFYVDYNKYAKDHITNEETGISDLLTENKNLMDYKESPEDLGKLVKEIRSGNQTAKTHYSMPEEFAENIDGYEITSEALNTTPDGIPIYKTGGGFLNEDKLISFPTIRDSVGTVFTKEAADGSKRVFTVAAVQADPNASLNGNAYAKIWMAELGDDGKVTGWVRTSVLMSDSDKAKYAPAEGGSGEGEGGTGGSQLGSAALNFLGGPVGTIIDIARD